MSSLLLFTSSLVALSQAQYTLVKVKYYNTPNEFVLYVNNTFDCAPQPNNLETYGFTEYIFTNNECNGDGGALDSLSGPPSHIWSCTGSHVLHYFYDTANCNGAPRISPLILKTNQIVCDTSDGAFYVNITCEMDDIKTTQVATTNQNKSRIYTIVIPATVFMIFIICAACIYVFIQKKKHQQITAQNHLETDNEINNYNKMEPGQINQENNVTDMAEQNEGVVSKATVGEV
eukprot:136761_1